MAATIADCPPCELPTQCARAMPRASSKATAVRAWTACTPSRDDRARLAEVRQVHEDATEVLRKPADRLVKRDPRGGAGTVGVEEQHRLPGAQIVVVHIHPSGGDGLAGARLGEAIRRDERHVFL